MISSLNLSLATPPSSPDEYASMEEGRSSFTFEEYVSSSSLNSPELTSRHIVRKDLDTIDPEDPDVLAKLIEKLPPELKKVFENYQNGNLSELKKKIPNDVKENLLSFVQTLGEIDFSSIARKFDNNSILSKLFSEIAEMGLDFSKIKSLKHLPQSQDLPTTLSSLFTEIQQTDFANLDTFFNAIESMPDDSIIKSLYSEVEELARPIIGLNKINDLDENSIPLHFRQYTEEIMKVKANPTKDIIGAILAYSIGFAPISLMGATLHKIKNLSSPLKFAIAASPTLAGAFACLFTGNQADKNGGKKTIKYLLCTQILGMASLSAIISSIDLSKMETFNLASLGLTASGLIASGALAGTGIATNPPALAISSRSDKEDKASARLNYAGGIGAITPGIALFMQAFLSKTLGLQYTYYVWLAMTILGTATSFFLLNDSVYHQLIHQNVPKEVAKKIAEWIGQELFPDLEIKDILTEFKNLNRKEKTSLEGFVLSHILGGGGASALTAILPLYFLKSNVSPTSSLLYAGSFAILSAIIRTLMGKTPLKNSGKLTTNIGLIGTLMSTSAMAFSPNIRISLIALTALGISNGMLKYGVFAWLREILPQKLGYATGIVGGLGTSGAPLISLAFGLLILLNKSSNTSYEYLLLSLLSIFALLFNIFVMPKNFERRQEETSRTSL